MYESLSDTYPRGTFRSVEEFLDLCAELHGRAPVLTARNCGDQYEDEHGNVVLCKLWT